MVKNISKAGAGLALYSPAVKALSALLGSPDHTASEMGRLVGKSCRGSKNSGVLIRETCERPQAEQAKERNGGGTQHPYGSSVLAADKLCPRRGILSYFLVPGARQTTMIGAADHVFAFIMPPLNSGHFIRKLNAIAIWVVDVDTNRVAVI